MNRYHWLAIAMMAIPALVVLYFAGGLRALIIALVMAAIIGGYAFLTIKVLNKAEAMNDEA